MKTIADAIARFIDRSDAGDFAVLIFIGGLAVMGIVAAIHG